MGFRPAPRRYRLVFDDPALKGLEVVARSVSIGEFMEMTGLDEATALSPMTLPDGAPVPLTMLQRFAETIAEWNLEDEDGKAVDVSFKALKDLDLSVVRPMVKAWLEGISGVSRPLDVPSASGETSEAASLGLESASESLPS